MLGNKFSTVVQLMSRALQHRAQNRIPFNFDPSSEGHNAVTVRLLSRSYCSWQWVYASPWHTSLHWKQRLCNSPQKQGWMEWKYSQPKIGKGADGSEPSALPWRPFMTQPVNSAADTLELIDEGTKSSALVLSDCLTKHCFCDCFVFLQYL